MRCITKKVRNHLVLAGAGTGKTTTIVGYVKYLTFHKLGLDIIASVQGKKPKIYSSDILQFVRRQLDVLTQDTTYLRKLCNYLTYNGAEQKSEFDFQTEEEYCAYLKYNPPVTLKKETVKSYGELDIANFLTQNGISYMYEWGVIILFPNNPKDCFCYELS